MLAGMIHCLEGTVDELLAGRYRVLRRLGADGMGTICLAEDLHLGRLTAVKVLDPSAEQRFRHEAQLVARVRHPSVAQVYDFDRLSDGQFLLAMSTLRVRLWHSDWSADPSRSRRRYVCCTWWLTR